MADPETSTAPNGPFFIESNAQRLRRERQESIDLRAAFQRIWHYQHDQTVPRDSPYRSLSPNTFRKSIEELLEQFAECAELAEATN